MWHTLFSWPRTAWNRAEQVIQPAVQTVREWKVVAAAEKFFAIELVSFATVFGLGTLVMTEGHRFYDALGWFSLGCVLVGGRLLFAAFGAEGWRKWISIILIYGVTVGLQIYLLVFVLDVQRDRQAGAFEQVQQEMRSLKIEQERNVQDRAGRERAAQTPTPVVTAVRRGIDAPPAAPEKPVEIVFGFVTGGPPEDDSNEITAELVDRVVAVHLAFRVIGKVDAKGPGRVIVKICDHCLFAADPPGYGYVDPDSASEEKEQVRARDFNSVPADGLRYDQRIFRIIPPVDAKPPFNMPLQAYYKCTNCFPFDRNKPQRLMIHVVEAKQP